jgi:pimeloyl-ACP methyl ester carboxylesterase
VDEYVSKGGHAYRPDLRIAIYRFINKHLKGDTGEVKDADFPKIEGKELRVFPEDSDLPKDAINAKADETFVPKAEVKLPAKPEDFPAWKAGLVKQLREKSFGALPEKVQPPEKGGGREGDFSRVETEPGITTLFSSASYGPLVDISGNACVVVLNPDDQWDEVLKGLPIKLPKTQTTVLVHPRGGGDIRWTRKNPPNTVERSLALLGQTVDSGRVRDVIAMARISPAISGGGNGKAFLIGRGQAGLIAAYAALLDPDRVLGVILIDPPASHRDGPHFLNVERVLDLPTALGLLAPDVKLTLINAKDPAFDKTAAIYKLAGAADKFERK